jgi:hypothetical protein
MHVSVGFAFTSELPINRKGVNTHAAEPVRDRRQAGDPDADRQGGHARQQEQQRPGRHRVPGVISALLPSLG